MLRKSFFRSNTVQTKKTERQFVRITSIMFFAAFFIGGIVSTALEAQTLNVEAPAASDQTTGNLPKRTTFGLWNVTCLEKQKCIASSALAKKDAQGQSKKIIEVRVESVAGKRTIYVQLPTGVLIKPGVSLLLGDASISLDYLMCGTSYCLASSEVTDDSMALMRKAPDMKVIIVMAPNAKTKVPTKASFTFSMEGSGAAMDELTK